jgi:predicted metalloprotease
MKLKFGGGGAFPDTYVIAHEVGHHMQNLMELLPKVQRAQVQSDQTTANAVSVRTELMAECLAGVWARYMNQRQRSIDDNGVRQAVATASAIGDDRLQQASRGTVVPDSFAHGSSQQRGSAADNRLERRPS